MNEDLKFKVKLPRKASEYYFAKINGVEYIRPVTMKYHDPAKQMECQRDEIDFILKGIDASNKLHIAYNDIEDVLEKDESADTSALESKVSALFDVQESYNQFFVEQYNSKFIKADFYETNELYNEKEEYEEGYTGKYTLNIITSFLNIGQMLKNKTYDDIGSFDNWDEDDYKKDVRNHVIDFVQDFGMLGILNDIFYGMERYDLTDNLDTLDRCNIEVDKFVASELKVGTIIYDTNIGHAEEFTHLSYKGDFDDTKKITRPYHTEWKIKGIRNKRRQRWVEPQLVISRISYAMNIMDYIKVFFPTDCFLYNYDEYRLMDERYWTKYSEPVYLFLIAAKKFYLRFMHLLKEAKSGDMRVLSPVNATIHFDYESSESPQLFLQFPSMLDAMIYQASNDILMKKQYIVACPYCGRVEESATYNKIYCSENKTKAGESCCERSAIAKRSRDKEKHLKQVMEFCKRRRKPFEPNQLPF